MARHSDGTRTNAPSLSPTPSARTQHHCALLTALVQYSSTSSVVRNTVWAEKTLSLVQHVHRTCDETCLFPTLVGVPRSQDSVSLRRQSGRHPVVQGSAVDAPVLARIRVLTLQRASKDSGSTQVARPRELRRQCQGHRRSPSTERWKSQLCNREQVPTQCKQA